MPDIEHPQLHRTDGQSRSRNLYGVTSYGCGIGDHQIHHRLKERDGMELCITGKVWAGTNFGLGSSRPVAALFSELGVAGLVAEEFNSLFFRNSVNAGLVAMTVPDATNVFGEGDTGTFDLSEGSWRNETTGASRSVPKLPDLILDIITSGGVLPRLAAQGYLPTELQDTLRSSTVAIRGAGSGA